MNERDGLALNEPVLPALGHSLLHGQHKLRKREPRGDGGERAARHPAERRDGVLEVDAPRVLPERLPALALLLSDDRRDAAPRASRAPRREGQPVGAFSASALGGAASEFLGAVGAPLSSGASGIVTMPRYVTMLRSSSDALVESKRL